MAYSLKIFSISRPLLPACLVIQKYVCSQLLQPLGLKRKGGSDASKPQNYSSVCRQ